MYIHSLTHSHLSLTHTHTHHSRLYSDDAAKTNKGIRPVSFCIELRDRSGFYGFVLPAEQVRQPACWHTHTHQSPILVWYHNDMCRSGS